jgi:thymidine kinase
MIKYTYSTMNGGKTTELIKTYHQLQQKGMKPVVAKPNLDDREGEYNGWGFTSSRITKDPVPAYYFDTIQEVIDKVAFGILLIDEVQFMMPDDIMKLTDIKQDVLAYGIKTDVNGNLFPAINKLMAIADTITEIPMLCENKDCKNKAVIHSRYIDGKVDKSSTSVMIESGAITYKSLCLNCWKKERGM